MLTIKTAYYSPDLTGDCFVRPVREWHAFLAKKIEESSCLISLAWRAGYLLHVILGAIALLGMIIKLFGIPP